MDREGKTEWAREKEYVNERERREQDEGSGITQYYYHRAYTRTFEK